MWLLKFTDTYNKLAHELLAKRGLAHALIYCEQEKSVGGLWVVVMDYISEIQHGN